jgi:hypothetical protein
VVGDQLLLGSSVTIQFIKCFSLGTFAKMGNDTAINMIKLENR